MHSIKANISWYYSHNNAKLSISDSLPVNHVACVVITISCPIHFSYWYSIVYNYWLTSSSIFLHFVFLSSLSLSRHQCAHTCHEKVVTLTCVTDTGTLHWFTAAGGKSFSLSIDLNFLIPLLTVVLIDGPDGPGAAGTTRELTPVDNNHESHLSYNWMLSHFTWMHVCIHW